MHAKQLWSAWQALALGVAFWSGNRWEPTSVPHSPFSLTPSTDSIETLAEAG